jgi:hypothetical protein
VTIMDLDNFVKISQALLTPVLAAIASYIAYQQWQTNKQKLVLDRYERRLKIYEKVREFLGIIIRDATVSIPEIMNFNRAVSEADFLFGREVSTYLAGLYSHAVKLHSWNAQYRDHSQSIPQNYDHQAVVKGMHDELQWLVGQYDPSKEIFRKYLDISR